MRQGVEVKRSKLGTTQDIEKGGQPQTIAQLFRGFARRQHRLKTLRQSFEVISTFKIKNSIVPRAEGGGRVTAPERRSVEAEQHAEPLPLWPFDQGPQDRLEQNLLLLPASLGAQRCLPLGPEVRDPASVPGAWRTEVFIEQIVDTLGKIRTLERMLAGIGQTIDESLKDAGARVAIVCAIPPLRERADGLVARQEVRVCQKWKE